MGIATKNKKAKKISLHGLKSLPNNIEAVPIKYIIVTKSINKPIIVMKIIHPFL
jgi:hypothetical protein